MHRSLNGELRQEVYDWKTKAHQNVNLQNKIDGQKVIIEQLTRDNQRLAQEVNDKVNKMRKEGLL
jgi:tRNA A37 N6-isopentenylltransferase MiaA